MNGTTKRASNKRAAITTAAELVVGLDIGYGVTKALTEHTSAVFPSVAGHAREIKFKADEIAQKYPGDQLSDDDGSWFIGELALSQLRSGEIRRLRGRTVNENEQGNVFRARMAKAALGKLLPDLRNADAVHVRLAVGLPVDHMRDSEDLKKALIGQHHIMTDTTNFIANITQVMVMPQPYGTIYSQMLTPKGEINDCHTASRTGVVDVGTYTIDVTMDEQGEYLDVLSGSVEAGVYLAHERIASALERDHRFKPDMRLIDHVLRTGCISVRGKSENYKHEVSEAVEPLREATLQLVSEKWGAALGADVIYLSGGGAPLVYEAVKASYPHAVLLADSQLANAQGYLNYALFAAQQD